MMVRAPAKSCSVLSTAAVGDAGCVTAFSCDAPKSGHFCFLVHQMYPMFRSARELRHAQSGWGEVDRATRMQQQGWATM